MKSIYQIVLIITALFINGCAITNSYGPFDGRVVVKATDEPIEGAVVFMQFYTEDPHIAGSNSVYADALETLTDANGEFHIPKYRIWTFRPLQNWGDPRSNHIDIIFKPGYGAFPRHPDVTADFEFPGGLLPEGRPVTIKLPKLKTKGERKKNLRNLYYDSTKIPPEKQKLIMKLSDEENVFLGLSAR